LRPTAAATKAKIVVEVEARNLPEARQFDTAHVGKQVAEAEMIEEGIPTVAETRTIEEIVTSERTSAKLHASQGSTAIYSTRRGSLRAEESYGEAAEFESELGSTEPMKSGEYSRSGKSPHHLASETNIPMAPPLPVSGEIKVLPDIKPTSREAFVEPSAPLPYSGSVQGPDFQQFSAGGATSGEQFSSTSQQHGSGGSAMHQAPQSYYPSSQPMQTMPQATSQPQVESAAPAVDSAAAEGSDTKKKSKSGFFKKFKSTKQHEQH